MGPEGFSAADCGLNQASIACDLEGVGRWVIAVAKDRDLKTVSLVRRPEVVKELSAARADVVLVDSEDIAERVAEATGHAQIKLALDGVAGNAMWSLTGSLSPGGTLVVYAFMSEQPGLANPRDIIFRDVTIRGFWLESPEIRNSPKLMEAIKAGARLVAEGKVRVPIAAITAAVKLARSSPSVLISFTARCTDAVSPA